ncbi:MAG TPA: matrixin family metalloprotease, partial [Isosphaeraceae bacterium]|nr:matrixin family metalloprotease [Isosphaeraceae bacterium]
MEDLEGRRLLAQFGVPWHHADHLTVSFVPDGTSIDGAPSVLFQTLNALEPAVDWQRAILEALQAWAEDTSVNFALKSDGGQPLGTPGPDQGDPRFGDIRIGALPMATGDLAISVPHDPFLSGTWSGDILLNRAALAAANPDELFPILLHEVGHVLGLDHSTDPESVMFEHLNQRDSLAPSDIAAVQALYGPRDDDPFEGPGRDDTFQTAAPMPEPAGYDGTTPLLIYANLSSLKDVDFYTVTAPDGYEGPLTIRLQTAGVSLLAPRLTVYDAAGHVLGDLSSATDVGDTLQVHLPRVEPGATYVLEVRGAMADPFGVGEYVLAASFDARSTVGPDAIDTLARQSYSYLSPEDIRAILLDPVHALFHVDAHTNDTLATAEDLDPIGVYGSEAPDRVTASLSDPT